nr:MAG TPA: hypothetical protein [Caudoviricetes sp.]
MLVLVFGVNTKRLRLQVLQVEQCMENLKSQ